MKHIIAAIIASFGFVSAFAQAPVKSDAPKSEMKLPKKKADKDKEANKAKEVKPKATKEPKK
jgi:hypothetical protein